MTLDGTLMDRDEKLARAREALRLAKKIHEEIVWTDCEEAEEPAKQWRYALGVYTETLRLLDEPDAPLTPEGDVCVPKRERRTFTTEQYSLNNEDTAPEPARMECLAWMGGGLRGVIKNEECTSERRAMLDRVRELEAEIKEMEETDDVWTVRVQEIVRERDTARERVKELEGENARRKTMYASQEIDRLEKELATERAAHERTKAMRVEDTVTINQGFDIQKDLERALADERTKHAERLMAAKVEFDEALLHEKAAHARTKAQYQRRLGTERGMDLVKDLEAKLAEANAAREKDRDEIRLAFQETHASEKKYCAYLLGEMQKELAASSERNLGVEKQRDMFQAELTQERERRERAEKELEEVKFKNRCYLEDIVVRDEVLDETCDEYDEQVAELEAELANLRFRLESLSK
jgi:hypothetical protein